MFNLVAYNGEFEFIINMQYKQKKTKCNANKTHHYKVKM